MTSEAREAIRQRVQHVEKYCDAAELADLLNVDIPALLAEVERLDAVIAWALGESDGAEMSRPQLMTDEQIDAEISRLEHENAVLRLQREVKRAQEERIARLARLRAEHEDLKRGSSR
jgi:hypothetical protein